MSRTLVLTPTRALRAVSTGRLHLTPTLSAGLQLRCYSAVHKSQARLEPANSLLKRDDLDGVMAIVMDRPEARNALSMQMVDEMRDAIAAIAKSPSARVIILHSTGPVFCAGADLRERKTMSQPRVAQFLDDLNAMVCELEDLALPTIAAVPGPALGGGTELALGCDLRTGQKETSFTLPETKLGIIPGAGGTQRLTKLLGMSRAMEIIFTGRRIAADEAKQIGLLDIIAPEGQSALDAAGNLAAQMLTSAPLSLRAAKKAIKAAPGTPIKEGLRLEREAYKPLLTSEDRDEGLRAFAEKRKPKFVGR